MAPTIAASSAILLCLFGLLAFGVNFLLERLDLGVLLLVDLLLRQPVVEALCVTKTGNDCGYEGCDDEGFLEVFFLFKIKSLATRAYMFG